MGLRRTAGNDLWVPTNPGDWVAPFQQYAYVGSRPGVVNGSIGFGNYKASVTEDGTYPFRVAPLWLLDTGTMRVALQLLDSANDPIGIVQDTYLAFGDVWEGEVTTVAGRGIRWLVGDDQGETLGQYILTGSIFEFPYGGGLRVGQIILGAGGVG